MLRLIKHLNSPVCSERKLRLFYLCSELFAVCMLVHSIFSDGLFKFASFPDFL
jgi:hypothetical protein